MFLHLPIAELSVNVFIIVGMGMAVGFLSGLFGVGGGFLITPLLIFYNIPPAIAVATGANQVIASSFSGALAHYKRRTIDLKLGTMLLIGGALGSLAGVWIFGLLRSLGQLDLAVSLLYVLLLSTTGGLMLNESVRSLLRSRKGGTGTNLRRPGAHNWVHGLPLKMRFPDSRLYVSIIPVLLLGFLIGVLAAIMGVGGGFIMVPAMIYLLRVPTNVVIGTSLFQIMFTAAVTTVLQAWTNETIDIVLAFLLMIGGVVGAQFGVEAGRKLRGDQLRALLAILVLSVGVRLGLELVRTPASVFSLASPTGEVE
ncbi:sulfite exporter TauE/SafE family protein [Fulvimarina sp. 2208YS6-2-32]|uniref:Probable membrane transporter protein n=1 Tax=Fulvimarina uroteuthidis TaxID=3098149 RepID=A0ABU5I2I7_9HYPH|nr:sulfite exporter TauE/SafE family protein [Fulvimarina sp. 2208YS6-2-32]MDY8109567.1 sulfite exporter TauE/SafE family protein [Fulvimarina sp. 2208YS6-2-32]